MCFVSNDSTSTKHDSFYEANVSSSVKRSYDMYVSEKMHPDLAHRGHHRLKIYDEFIVNL